MNVSTELLGQFLTSDFLDLDDDRIIDHMLGQHLPGTRITLAQLSGMNRESLRAKLKELLPPRQADSPDEIPVSPQAQRKYYRKRLADRSNSVVARILSDLQLSPVGRHVGKAVKSVARLDNRKAVTELLNRAVNDALGIDSGQRAKMTLEQARTAYESLDEVADSVRESIRKEMTT